MSWDTVQQFARLIAQFGAGYLVQNGLITEDMSTTLVGSALSLGGIAWWVFWDRNRTA
jgi:hypothetical protein